jgi:hypothetical protein
MNQIKKYSYTPNTPKLIDIATSLNEISKKEPKQVIPCVLFCASVLESFINESYEFYRYLPKGDQNTSRYNSQIRGYVFELADKVKNRELIHDKYNYALEHFYGSSKYKSEELYDSFKILIALRNEIVHNKPEVFISYINNENNKSDLKEYPKFIRQLKSKKVINHIGDDDGWLSIIQNEDVSKWALGTMNKMIKLFIDGLDEGDYKDMLLTYYG